MATNFKTGSKTKPYGLRYYFEGRQRQKSFTTAKERKDWLVKFEHDSRENTFVDPKIANEKFGAVADRWLTRKQGAPKTLKQYELVIRRHVKPAFGGKTLAKVASDREAVQDWVWVTLPQQDLGASAIRGAYLVLNSIVNDAVRSGRLKESRIRGIPLPAVSPKAEIPYATHEQIKAIAAEMPSAWAWTVYLMRGCGLRLGEALGVRAEDIRKGTLRLSRQMTPAGVDMAPLKHRGAEDFRDIPVPQYVLDAMPRGFKGFPAIDHRVYRVHFNRARDKAGLPSTFTPHVLRHIFASIALAGGIPITDVSKWLGHRDINITFGIYGHLVPASWDRARQVLDDEWAS